MDVALKICRYDPEKDTSPYFQELAVSIEENRTVLDALLLAWQQDPTLSFRRSCRSAICGSCAILINGQPALACQTLIRKAAANGGALPLGPFPISGSSKILWWTWNHFLILSKPPFRGCS